MEDEYQFSSPYCVKCKKELIIIWKCPECGVECEICNCGIMRYPVEEKTSKK